MVKLVDELEVLEMVEVVKRNRGGRLVWNWGGGGGNGGKTKIKIYTLPYILIYILY